MLNSWFRPTPIPPLNFWGGGEEHKHVNATNWSTHNITLRCDFDYTCIAQGGKIDLTF